MEEAMEEDHGLLHEYVRLILHNHLLCSIIAVLCHSGQRCSYLCSTSASLRKLVLREPLASCLVHRVAHVEKAYRRRRYLCCGVLFGVVWWEVIRPLVLHDQHPPVGGCL